MLHNLTSSSLIPDQLVSSSKHCVRWPTTTRQRQLVSKIEPKISPRSAWRHWFEWINQVQASTKPLIGLSFAAGRRRAGLALVCLMVKNKERKEDRGNIRHVALKTLLKYAAECICWHAMVARIQERLKSWIKSLQSSLRPLYLQEAPLTRRAQRVRRA